MTTIDDIRARWAKATPGPWAPCPMGHYIFSPRMEMVADTDHDDDESFRLRGVGGKLPMEANIVAIAAAPTDIAALLAALDAEREAKERAEAERGPSITRADARELLEMSDLTTPDACYERVRAALRVWAGGDFECHQPNPLDEARAEVERLTKERMRYRVALDRVARACGGFASPEMCSVEFMEAIPHEVESTLRVRDAQLAALREAAGRFVDLIGDPPDDVRGEEREVAEACDALRAALGKERSDG